MADLYKDHKDIDIVKINCDNAKCEVGGKPMPGYPMFTFYTKNNTEIPLGPDDDYRVEAWNSFMRDNGANAKGPFITEDRGINDNVFVVNHENFEEIVNDKTKDVLVTYAGYASIKQLNPFTRELSTLYKDHPSIKIVKIWAKGMGFEWNGKGVKNPHIIFYPKGNKAGVDFDMMKSNPNTFVRDISAFMKDNIVVLT
jgi:hypothetical protein